MTVRNYSYAAQNGATTVGAALSGATTGVKLTYTVPAGKQATITGASIGNMSGAPTVQIRITTGGVTVVRSTGTANQTLSGQPQLQAGDTCDINVSALVAATTFDGAIDALEYSAT